MNQIPLIAAISAGLLISACSEPAKSEQQTISVYTTRHYDSDQEIYKAFEEKTGIRVRARDGNSTGLLESLKAEGEASPADLVIATDAGTLWRFQEADLLQPITSSKLESVIPERFREPSGYWFGLSKRARVIVYDPARYAAEDVTDYRVLSSETYSDEVCMRPSSNIYNLSLMGELIDRWGEDDASDWAKAVTDNFARQPTGGDTTQIESIAAGECSIALVNHYYWARLRTHSSDAKRATAAATALSFPSADQGTHVNITGGAVTKHAPNKDGAIAFLEFLASPEGQALLITETKEFPMLSSVPLPEGLEGLGNFNSSDIQLTIYGENQIAAQKIYDRAGWK